MSEAKKLPKEPVVRPITEYPRVLDEPRPTLYENPPTKAKKKMSKKKSNAKKPKAKKKKKKPKDYDTS